MGLRTVTRPGADAAVLRLDNEKFLAMTIDGNPKQCYLNPRQGAIGCFEEACRNVACTGAEPIGMVDHLQFGNPENPEIFWTFLESLHGIADFAKYMKIPCIGGKVSLYNETPRGPIKPTPVIGVLGLSDVMPPRSSIREGDSLFILGETNNEMGGSEYYEYIHGLVGGHCPEVDLERSKNNMTAVISLIRENRLHKAHDCSKGGMAVAVSEMCMTDGIGCNVRLNEIPGPQLATDVLLFSESHSRYILAVPDANKHVIEDRLLELDVKYGIIGEFGGNTIEFEL